MSTVRALQPRRRRARGFTLIEAVIVITLVGSVAAMVAVFIPNPINAYMNQSRRSQLSDTADTALRRMTRELGRALPNSVRVAGGGRYVEFMPVKAAGRYRAAPDSSGSTTGTSNPLDFDDPTDNSFAVLGPTVDAEAGSQLVIYNLGIPGSDVYNSNESRRALAVTGNALATINYTLAGAQFPFASPGHRFHLVTLPVTYACLPGAGGTGSLRRYTGYATQAAQPTDATAAPLSALTAGGAANTLIADLVTDCSFSFSPGASTRTGLVTLRLTLASSGEQITLLQQVHVDNSP